jgi:hypothetical protein
MYEYAIFAICKGYYVMPPAGLALIFVMGLSTVQVDPRSLPA